MYKRSDQEIQVGYRVKNCDAHDCALVQTGEHLVDVLRKGLGDKEFTHGNLRFCKDRIVFACSDPCVADDFIAFLVNKPIKVKPKMRLKFKKQR